MKPARALTADVTCCYGAHEAIEGVDARAIPPDAFCALVAHEEWLPINLEGMR